MRGHAGAVWWPPSPQPWPDEMPDTEPLAASQRTHFCDAPQPFDDLRTSARPDIKSVQICEICVPHFDLDPLAKGRFCPQISQICTDSGVGLWRSRLDGGEAVRCGGLESMTVYRSFDRNNADSTGQGGPLPHNGVLSESRADCGGEGAESQGCRLFRCTHEDARPGSRLSSGSRRRKFRGGELALLIASPLYWSP